MPDLASLLQQHVEQLSQTPSAGFAGVRAKARRRSQQRAGAFAAAALVVVGAVLAGTGTFSHKAQGPAHPVPSVTTTVPAPRQTPTAALATPAAALVQTHWRMTSITAFGSTTQLNDEQDYLYMTFQGHFLIREHCGNITGGAGLGQTITFTVGVPGSTVAGTPGCAQQPLSKQLAEVLRSPLNNDLHGNQLTLVGSTGAITFAAVPETVPASPLTSRVWQLTTVKTSTSTTDLSSYHGTSPDALWLTFGTLTGNFLAGTGCDAVQGTAVTSGHDLDLAGLLPAPTGGCSAATKATHTALVDAYTQLVKDGRVLWTVTGTTLELRGSTTVLTFTDHGPASALQPSAAPSS